SGLLAWVGLAPWFYWIGRQSTVAEDFFRSLILGISFQATLNYWLLAMHPLTWLGISYATSLVVVVVAWAGVASFIGSGIALGGTVYGILVRRFLRAGGPCWLLPLLAATFWFTFEWAQTKGDLAYPWGALALSQVSYLPLLQLLPIGGPYLLAGILAGSNAALAEGWRGERRPLLVAGGLVSITLLYGFWALRPTPTGTVPVALIQGNARSEEKWDPHLIEQIATRYLELSAQATAARLVVWPESAIPILWNDPANTGSQALVNRIHEAFDRSDRYLLTGAFFYRPRPHAKDVDLFNATTLIGNQQPGWQWEAKRHLVPFGEFMPFRSFLPDILAKLNVLTHDLSRGAGPNPFTLPGGLIVGTGVCFDSIFPLALVADTAASASLLAVVTNDAWYKDTAAPHQHFAHAILRAVENRRFLLRAANTGISGIVDPYGRVLTRSRTFTPAVVTGKIAPQHELTLFTRWGNWLLWPSLAILTGAALWAFKKKGSSSKCQDV
ncbi:MAG: apolipoprotein N-acyltransferase, partial [Cyanobacteria bacterium NC_groundwater_1444_Ag_S-0.65um_54_12]|nr:apolipoprotein N-acyltransferase [Cyanobacteria bacterium NC_groundwater_1444_Ag_S-0.65um_54_12]